MTLVHLRLRRGEAVAEPREVAGTGILYFCAKGICPHYKGQLGLVPGAETMVCALVQYSTDHICQPFYLEVAEDLDRNRRQSWEQRLEEAEAFEIAVATAAAGGAP
jgi:phosphoribosylformylglycinamidine (FGAM) synthase-like amidotransferase family enzyme